MRYWAIGITLNLVSISVEAFTRGHYKNRRTLMKLGFYALLGPAFYHWINSSLYILGNIKLIVFNKTGWGKMDLVALTKGRLKEVIVLE